MAFKGYNTIQELLEKDYTDGEIIKNMGSN